MSLADRIDDLQRENELLRKALREQQEIAECERRAAQLARESAARAWSFSTVGSRPPRDGYGR